MHNWKTTLIGILGAIWFAVQPILINGNFTLDRDWKSLVTAGIVAGLGYLAQDYSGNNTTTKAL